MKAENVVVGLYGWKGAGKTTALTLFAYLEYLYGNRKHLFTNYEFLFTKDWKWLNGRDMIDLTDKLNDSAVFIDELHEYADARNANSMQNKRVADFFLQSRHTRSNVYYSTQFKDQVDKRIRRITDIDIVCENLFVDSDKDGDDDIFKLMIVDRRLPDIPGKEIRFYAKPVFSMFDSTERINPFVFVKRDVEQWREKVGSLTQPSRKTC